ncbi:hypothetical protein L9F63_017624 [Diploptera punctata]|uniref:Uncharacterized protein n=1 Tax=Diploptera punctata TaxID=6984 RepID=A0AAD8EGI9_DIPPU|nr:hypothetical protein L9F63_017624 [Diploptera punctata]
MRTKKTPRFEKSPTIKEDKSGGESPSGKTASNVALSSWKKRIPWWLQAVMKLWRVIRPHNHQQATDKDFLKGLPDLCFKKLDGGTATEDSTPLAILFCIRID